MGEWSLWQQSVVSIPSAVGADRGLQHHLNQINIVLLYAAWERDGCDFLLLTPSWLLQCLSEIMCEGVRRMLWVCIFLLQISAECELLHLSWNTVDGDHQLCAAGECPAFDAMQVPNSSLGILSCGCSGRSRNNSLRVFAAFSPTDTKGHCADSVGLTVRNRLLVVIWNQTWWKWFWTHAKVISLE